MSERVRSWLRSPALFVLLAVGAVVLVSSLRKAGAQAGEMIPADQRQAMAAISVTSLGGETWRLADQRGQVVVVNYFATWCPPCRAETPDFVDLSNAYAQKGVRFVGLSLDRGEADVVRQFVSRFSIPYPVAVVADDGELTRGISAIPVTRLVDRQGRLARTYVGAVDRGTLKADIESLLGE